MNDRDVLGGDDNEPIRYGDAHRYFITRDEFQNIISDLRDTKHGIAEIRDIVVATQATLAEKDRVIDRKFKVHDLVVGVLAIVVSTLLMFFTRGNQ